MSASIPKPSVHEGPPSHVVHPHHGCVLQLRAPGRHHGSGLSEPGALRDGGGSGQHREGLEDHRGVPAGVPRPRVCAPPQTLIFPLSFLGLYYVTCGVMPNGRHNLTHHL